MNQEEEMEIDAEKLVSDIKQNEKAWKEGRWERTELSCRALIDVREVAELAITDFGTNMDSFKDWFPEHLCYRAYMHCLYTLRAWCRGRIHRQNPPQELRGFNYSMRESGNDSFVRPWDMEKHNRYIAEKQAKNYGIAAAGAGASL